MGFAIIDHNCTFIDIEPIKKVLKENSFSICEQQIGQELGELVPPKSNMGIYVSSISDIALKRQCDMIRNAKDVEQWLILIVDTENSGKKVREIAVSSFRQKLANTKKDLTVICDDVQNIASQIPDEIEKLRWLQSNIVLITSARKHVGRKTTADVLAELNPEYHFEVCDLKDLPQKKEYARRIVIIGAEPKDFAVPVIDGARYKLTLIYNKIDCAPIKAIHSQREKEAVIRVLNENNWDLPVSFKEFYMCSMKYELLFRALSSSASSADELRLNREFAMWDKYGLPCGAEQYTSENICRFLEEVCIADEILK